MTLCLCRYIYVYFYVLGFPGGSDGKEPACNAGDPSLIPGEGNGFSPQYSAWRTPWTEEPAGRLSDRVRLPVQERLVRSLCWEDLLEKGVTIQFIILAWRIPWTEGLGSL